MPSMLQRNFADVPPRPSVSIRYQKDSLKERKITLPSKSSPMFVEQALYCDTPPWEWEPPNSHQSIPTDFLKTHAPETRLQQLYLALIHDEFEGCISCLHQWVMLMQGYLFRQRTLK